MQSGIYQIINVDDPTKFYIGSAVNLGRRKTAHWRAFQANKHHNRHLQAAWNLRGASNITKSR